MKRVILFSFIFTFALSITPSLSFAATANTFTCQETQQNIGGVNVTVCSTVSNCNSGYAAKFPDGATCEQRSPVCFGGIESNCQLIPKTCTKICKTDETCVPDANGGKCINDTPEIPQNPGGGTGGGGNGEPPLVGLGGILTSLAGQQSGGLFTFSGELKLGTIVGKILPLLYTIAGMLLLVFMIFSGFKFLTSAGDAKKTEQAKDALTAAIVGFIIIIAAFFITQIANTVFKLGAGI